MARGQGLEPRFSAPKAGVLPLGRPPKVFTRNHIKIRMLAKPSPETNSLRQVATNGFNIPLPPPGEEEGRDEGGYRNSVTPDYEHETGGVESPSQEGVAHIAQPPESY
jgi:hypothetical protein